KNPPVILYLYSYPFENDRFLNPEFGKFLTKNGFAAVGFASALTGQRYHPAPHEGVVCKSASGIAGYFRARRADGSQLSRLSRRYGHGPRRNVRRWFGCEHRNSRGGGRFQNQDSGSAGPVGRLAGVGCKVHADSRERTSGLPEARVAGGSSAPGPGQVASRIEDAES